MLLKSRKRGKGKLLEPQGVVGEGCRGGGRMSRGGGAVIGSEEGKLTKLTLHEIPLVYDGTLVSHHCGF